MKYNFSKQIRLLTSDQFAKVFTGRPRRLTSTICALLYVANSHPPLNKPRLGLVVAKKNIRDAVERNRFKRVVRESFRLRQNELPQIDIVIIAHRGAATATNEEIRQCLTKYWDRLIQDAKKA